MLARKIQDELRNQQQRRPGTARILGHASQKNVAEGRGVASAAQPLRVLLVEDEPLIRLTTADILAGLGHSVDEAERPTQALPPLHQRNFDVLITDLRLPGLGGDELAAQAIARQPELRIVFASGYEVLPKREGREELAGAVLLQKPENERGIVDALDAVMSAPAKSRAT